MKTADLTASAAAKPIPDAYLINDVPVFLVAVIAASLVVRLATSTLWVFEVLHKYPHNRFRQIATKFFDVRMPEGHRDFFHPFFLGTMELAAYPVLFTTNHPTYVGAWIAFKAVVQWKAWSESRRTFNRFLIGNALVLLFSVVFLTEFVDAV